MPHGATSEGREEKKKKKKTRKVAGENEEEEEEDVLPREVVENKVWGSPLPPHLNPMDYAQRRPSTQHIPSDIDKDNVAPRTKNNKDAHGMTHDELRALGLNSSSSSYSSSTPSSSSNNNNSASSSADASNDREPPAVATHTHTPASLSNGDYAHPRNAPMFALSESTTNWELIRYNGYMTLILDRFLLHCDRCDSGEYAQKRAKNKPVPKFPMYFTSLHRLLLGDYLLRFCVEQRNRLDVAMDSGGARGHTLLMFFFYTLYKVVACAIRLIFMKPEGRALLVQLARESVNIGDGDGDGDGANKAWELEEEALEELVCSAEGFFLAKPAHFPHVIHAGGCCVPPQIVFSMLTQSQLYRSIRCLAYRWREFDYHSEFHRYLTCLFYRHAILVLEEHNSQVFDDPLWRRDMRTPEEVEDNKPIRYACNEAYLWNTTAMMIDMFTDRFIAEGGYCATPTFEDPLEVLGRLVCDMQIPDPDEAPAEYQQFKARLRKSVQLWYMREFVLNGDSPEWRESVITAGWITGRRPGESAMFFRESRFVQMTRPETLWYETRMKIELDYRQYAKSVEKRAAEAMVDEDHVGRISAGIALHKVVMPALERDFSEKGNALERSFPIIWSWCVFLQMPVVEEHTGDFFHACAVQIMGEFFLVSRNTMFRTYDLQTALFWWFMTSPRQDIQRRRDELRTFLMTQGFEFTSAQRKCNGMRKRWNDQRYYRVCKSAERYEITQDWRWAAWVYWETNRFEPGAEGEKTNGAPHLPPARGQSRQSKKNQSRKNKKKNHRKKKKKK